MSDRRIVSELAFTVAPEAMTLEKRVGVSKRLTVLLKPGFYSNPLDQLAQLLKERCGGFVTHCLTLLQYLESLNSGTGAMADNTRHSSFPRKRK